MESIIIIVFSLILFATCIDAQLQLSPHQPKQTKAVNDSFFVTCRSEPSAGDVKDLKWFSPNNTVIPASKRSTGRIYAEKSPSGSGLFFNKARLKDSGDYTCRGMLDGKEISVSFQLEVYKRITFVNSPLIQYGPVGTDHVIKCVAKSKPASNVAWHYVKRSTNDTNKYEIIDGRGLKIYNVDREDAGVYTCMATMFTTVISEFKEHPIKFVPQYPPDCKDSQQQDSHPETSPDDNHQNQRVNKVISSVYTYIGGKVNVTCEARAEPAPNFTWSKKNGHSDAILPQFTDGIEIFSVDEFTSILQLTTDDVSDLGDYVCNATNFLGSCVHVINVDEVDKPGVPDLIRVTSEAAGSMKVVVDAPKLENGSSAQQYLPLKSFRIQYKRHNDTWESATTSEVDFGENAYVIKGLDHETQYTVRVAAGSRAGFGNYSEEQVYKTMSLSEAVKSNENSAASVYSSSVCVLTAIFLLLVKC